MASTPGSRAVFVQSAVDFLLKHAFDGLDMDWEYPANRGGIAEDRVSGGNFYRKSLGTKIERHVS